jgi:hypothetical protein
MHFSSAALPSSAAHHAESNRILWSAVRAVNSNDQRALLVLPNSSPSSTSWDAVPLEMIMTFAKEDSFGGSISAGSGLKWANPSSIDDKIDSNFESVLDADEKLGDMGSDFGSGVSDEKRVLKQYSERRKKLLEEARQELDAGSNNGSDDDDGASGKLRRAAGSRTVSSFIKLNAALSVENVKAKRARENPEASTSSLESTEHPRQTARTEGSSSRSTAGSTTMPPPAPSTQPSRTEVLDRLRAPSVQQLLAAAGGAPIDAVVKLVLPTLAVYQNLKAQSREQQRTFVTALKRVIGESLRAQGFTVQENGHIFSALK